MNKKCKHCGHESDSKSELCTKCLRSFSESVIEKYPENYEQLEIKLILDNDELKKEQEKLIGEELKISIKKAKEALKSLRTPDEKEEEDDKRKDNPDNFKGDEF